MDQNNKDAIEWSKGRPARHVAKRKHIDITRNYVMELIVSTKVKTNKMGTSEMIADYLTKPLIPKEFAERIDRGGIF